MKKLLLILLCLPMIGFTQNSITPKDKESIFKLVSESESYSPCRNCDLEDYLIIKSEEFFIVFCESNSCGCYLNGCPIYLCKKEKDQFIELDMIDYCFDKTKVWKTNRLIFECITRWKERSYMMYGGKLVIVNKKSGKFEPIKGTSFQNFYDNEGEFISPDSIK